MLARHYLAGTHCGKDLGILFLDCRVSLVPDQYLVSVVHQFRHLFVLFVARRYPVLGLLVGVVLVPMVLLLAHLYLAGAVLVVLVVAQWYLVGVVLVLTVLLVAQWYLVGMVFVPVVFLVAD